MGMKEEITGAIAAHGQWKARLSQAIETGKSDFTVAGVMPDNQCAFGKWMYGASIPADQKGSEGYRACRELHAKFHPVAAHVLEMALAGKKEEAKKAIGLGSEFSNLTSSLTAAMMKWMKSAS